MGRKSKTQQLTESMLGQHLALSVGAHLARTQLVADPLSVYDGQHMSEMLDAVGNALAKVAPLYVQDTNTGSPRELTPAEVEGAAVRCGATLVVLKDGRTLSSVSMKRADLRQAIAILKAAGVPGLRPAPARAEPAPRNGDPSPLHARMVGLQALLREPLIPPQVEKANALAVAIARTAREGRVANLAMQLMSAVHETSREGEVNLQRVALALARLRVAVEEMEQSGPLGR